jgi:serine/threonine protein kinase
MPKGSSTGYEETNELIGYMSSQCHPQTQDIAARNIMIGEHLAVYVADFGFARAKQKGDSYGKTKTALGPIKWMAPESMNQKVRRLLPFIAAR